ncbi:5'-nucleotidase /3'-nucleotidase /exopolyphosphatase [Limimonas halophila]|uniref:5'-nucleotidase SurE n=1 Tax=Limimonas halophila TaxID=1082479 RepID=A0A1G7NH07_9PROT|nr:5'/3'-nucleotidase SurE [Limimonas halophila]SDF73313.1 5'-nucleotidase /3'-nucleotidase /exopolyphosphatase [Limimonas halophila]
MADPRPLDLSHPRILVTNDDGINAPGLQVLERIAGQLSSDVWTVAPEMEQSATSHSLTVRRPLRLRHLDTRRYAVDGTPTDCVVVAARKVLKAHPPDLVLSGVNQGSNLGEDVTYSGTVAAAMEAALLGLPAIALSQAHSGDHRFHWETAERHAAEVIRRVAETGFLADSLVNVNFPDRAAGEVAGVRVCPQGRRDLDAGVVEGFDPGGRPYVWIGDYAGDACRIGNTDLTAVADGWIAVTPLHLDLTERDLLDRLREAFA